MKKCAFILTICLFLIPAIVGHTDVISEPLDFYGQYRSECVFLDRSFVNSGNTPVPVMAAPDSNKKLAVIESGEVIHINYSCLYKGEFWGINFKNYVWVRLSKLLVLYDYVAFEEEHSEELYTYKGEYSEIKETKSAIAWPWPGADSPMWTIEDLDTTNFKALHAYKDSEGREWGLVTYLYDSPNIWFCLSEPLNRDIPVFNPSPEPMVWKSETPHQDIAELERTDSPSVLTFIIILVIGLVVGTAVLIRVFWNTNRADKGREEE